MPENSQLTRQQIYDRIRQTSKQEYILEEMIRLGFWPSDQEAPGLPEQLIRTEGELARELNELLEKQRKYQSREQMLREMRKKRLAESRQKQAETKARRQREREARATQWAEQKTKAIVYLGAGVSGGLHQKESAPERLEKHQLPAFANVAALAQAMNVSLGELRFLSFHRKVTKTSHYKRFYMLKKSGGVRLISAPMPRLKTLQHWVLANILQHLPLHPAVHGFRPEYSVVTNAAPHLGQELVVNLDIKDFFPTVTYKRVKGLFQGFGYAEQIATILALICTEPDVDEVVLDGVTYYVAKKDGLQGKTWKGTAVSLAMLKGYANYRGEN